MLLSKCLMTPIFCCHLICLIKRAVYSSWNTEWDRQNFLSFWANFCPFNSPHLSWYQKSKLKKKKEKMPGDIILLYILYPFIHVHHKWISYYDRDMGPEKQGATGKFFSFWAIFWSFSPLKTQKIILKLKKKKKTPGDIILHICTINYNCMMYGSWNMECARQNFFYSGMFFALLPP